MNDDFLAKCRSLDPSSEIDREKNREIIKARLLKEEENVIMFKNKRIRKPAVVAAVLIAVMSLSAVVYAAAPMFWRYFDTQVVQGEEFVTGFWMAEMEMPDGTMSVGGGIDIDREALEAAGGGAVIVEVEGEKQVILDELHLDSVEEGLALLQIENPLIPSFIPEGFSFDRFTFRVNPNIHEYMLGTLPAAKNAFIHYSDGDKAIQFQVSYVGNMMAIMASYDLGQQSLIINGNKAVLSSGLSEQEISGLEGVTLYDSSTNWDDFGASFGSVDRYGETNMIFIQSGGVLYSISSRDVSLYDLVRMAVSMQ